MITGIAFLIILTAVVLRGGDLTGLAEIRPRHAWTVIVAILIQFVVITLLAARLPFVVASGLHLASYGLALLFVVLNRKIPGILLTVLGGVMNLVAIVANGGVMPATTEALEFAGKPVATEEFENSTSQDDAKLVILGDVFAFPKGMPFANVFSLGDIVLVVGGYVLVSRACFRDDEDDFDGVPSADEPVAIPMPAAPANESPPATVDAPVAAAPPATETPDTRAPGWYRDPSGVTRWWTGQSFSTFVTAETPRGRSPGWYPDPDIATMRRWWTGEAWSAYVAEPTPSGQHRPDQVSPQ